MNTLGNRIRAVRLAIKPKPSQTKFAAFLGTSRSALNEYERDRVVPNDTFLQLVAQKFSVNYTWLKTGEGEMRDESEAQIVEDVADQFNLDPKQRQFLRILLRMDPEKRDVVAEAFFAFVEEYQKDDDADIEAEVENYRKERIAEKKKSKESGIHPPVENGA